MFKNTDSLAPQDEVLKLFQYAKWLLERHQDNNVEFWQNIDATALEVWLREDHPDKASILNSRAGLSDIRELLSRHLAKMRCAAEWTHRIFEVDTPELQPNHSYFPQFSALCDDYPKLIRDAYIHCGLGEAVQTFMTRWYVKPKVSLAAGEKRALPHALIKASDNEALTRLLSLRWDAGERFYADRDLLRPIIGDASSERQVLIFVRLDEWENAPLSLVSDNAGTVVEQGPRTSRLTETFSDGLLRLPLTSSGGYLDGVRSRVAVLYLFNCGALFVEYPWNRFGAGHSRLEQAYELFGGKLPTQGTQFPIEQRDEVDEIGLYFKESVRKLSEWGVKALSEPAPESSAQIVHSA